MELTNILGQAFLVNVDSVVYAYTRGSGSTLVMSRNKELVYVTESVSEVVTASGTGLVAFTSTEGDVTGSVAINPNYIQTVTSVDGGDSSGLILGDNSGVRATLVVTTDYSAMDAIVEASGGGAAATVVAKTADFTADGASGTIYAMDGTGPSYVTATIGESLDIGTKYTFLAYVQDGLLTVRPASGETITYNDGSGESWTATNATGINLTQYGSHITAVKVSATEWYSIAESWVEPEA